MKTEHFLFIKIVFSIIFVVETSFSSYTAQMFCIFDHLKPGKVCA